MIENHEFVNKLLSIRENYKTCYALGTFGQLATETLINTKANQYPKWYSKSRVNKLKSLSNDTRLFDCVGLIKAVVWGFPKLEYQTNGLLDGNNEYFWNSCSERSEKFDKIEVGELLWMKGHVGVYIGNGKAIECTASWSGNVMITAVGNIGAIPGLNKRHWKGHGKLPFIKYSSENNEAVLEPSAPSKDYSKIAKEVIDGKWGIGIARKKKLKSAGYTDEEIAKIQLLVNEMLKHPKETKEQTVYYTVKKGDVAYLIARKYGISIEQMKKLNPSINNLNLIYPGQKIRVK